MSAFRFKRRSAGPGATCSQYVEAPHCKKGARSDGFAAGVTRASRHRGPATLADRLGCGSDQGASRQSGRRTPGPGSPVAATCDADTMNEHGASVSKQHAAFRARAWPATHTARVLMALAAVQRPHQVKLPLRDPRARRWLRCAASARAVSAVRRAWHRSPPGSQVGQKSRCRRQRCRPRHPRHAVCCRS